MNFTVLVSRSDFHPSNVPNVLWESYLEYLWYYQADSWVSRMAYAFRVLAVSVAFPFIILTLFVRGPTFSRVEPKSFIQLVQDIASYVVARTLGIVDEGRAVSPVKN